MIIFLLILFIGFFYELLNFTPLNKQLFLHGTICKAFEPKRKFHVITKFSGLNYEVNFDKKNFGHEKEKSYLFLKKFFCF